MDNVFEEAVDNTAVGKESTLGSEYDLDLTPDEDDAEESAETAETEEGEGGVAENLFAETPTNQAFAQMRTQNKQYSDKLNEIDAIAKAAGLKDIDDFIKDNNLNNG